MAKRKADKAAATLSVVKREIAKQKLEWEAGPTPLSEAPPAEIEGHFGLAMGPELLSATADKVNADENFWGAFGVFTPPPAIDWRNNGGDFVKEARYQDSCNSCVAFAVVGAVEAAARIACRNPSLDIALSETDLFACGCGPCCVSGWYPKYALDHCVAKGIASAKDVPYKPYNVACPSGISSRFRISAWQQLTTRPSIQKAVCEQGPCVYGMMAYDDFRFYKGGIYRHATGWQIGRHAILIVGYDEPKQYWICKNSWGPRWGENGYFRIYYVDASFFGPGYAFPAFSVTVPCPGTPHPPEPPQPPDCMQYVPALKDIIRAAWADPALKNYLRYWACGLGQQPPVNSQYEPIANHVRSVMQTCPESLRTWFCDYLLKN